MSADAKPSARTPRGFAAIFLALAGIQAVAATENEAALFKASAEGNVETVRRLLDAGLKVDAVDTPFRGDGQTALHHAMRAKDAAVARFLIERGASVNAKANSGYTPLHVAAGLGRTQHVRLLLVNGADVHAIDARGAPLHAAVVGGHAGTVELLLLSGANPNARVPGGGKQTPLTLLGSVMLFLPTHNSIVKQLVDAGADVNARSAYGEHPFTAMVRADEDTALYLLDKGAQSSGLMVNREPITFAFAAEGKLRVLERLLANGHSINERNEQGATLLHYVVYRGNEKAAGWLLSKGLDPDARSNSGSTTLHYAAFLSHPRMIDLVLRSGADANAQDKNGRTAVYILLASPEVERFNLVMAARAIDSLRQHGAKMMVRDYSGMTPLSWFVRHASIPIDLDVPFACEVANQVVKAGGAIDFRDGNGDSVLHSLARRQGSSSADLNLPRFVDCLIGLGASVEAKNDDGETPLDVAKKNLGRAGAEVAKALTRRSTERAMQPR